MTSENENEKRRKKAAAFGDKKKNLTVSGVECALFVHLSRPQREWNKFYGPQHIIKTKAEMHQQTSTNVVDERRKEMAAEGKKWEKTKAFAVTMLVN